MFSAVRSGRIRGFTLIEVMIVVAIVAILVSIALPSYRQYILRANRSAVESFMMTVAQKQEQYLLDARGYANALASLGLVEPNDVRDNYTVTTSYVGGSSRTYFIQAVPKGVQTEDSCGTLSLDNNGQKLPITERCW